MFTGAHVLLYTTDAEADRAFIRDVLELDHVDSGGGWLIFALPKTELGVHPAASNGKVDLSLLTDDIAGFVDKMTRKGVQTSAISDQGWGLIVTLTLPSGTPLGVYQPRHGRPD